MPLSPSGLHTCLTPCSPITCVPSLPHLHLLSITSTSQHLSLYLAYSSICSHCQHLTHLASVPSRYHPPVSPTIHSLHNSFHHASSTPHHNYFPFSPFILASSAPHPSPHPSHPIHLPSTPLIPTTCSLSSTPSARSGGIPRSHISRLFTMRSTYLGLSMLHDSSMNADEVFTSSLADIPDRFVHPSRLVSEAM